MVNSRKGRYLENGEIWSYILYKSRRTTQLTIFSSQNVIFYGLFLVSQESFLNVSFYYSIILTFTES